MRTTEEQALRDLVRQEIRKRREALGLTQEALCERAGISIDAVTRIENGKRVPSLSTLARIAGALDIRVVDLLAGAPAPRQRPRLAALRRIEATLVNAPPQTLRAAEAVVRALVKALR